jgi:hypothetical protein
LLALGGLLGALSLGDLSLAGFVARTEGQFFGGRRADRGCGGGVRNRRLRALGAKRSDKDRQQQKALFESHRWAHPILHVLILRACCIGAKTALYRFVSGCIRVHPHGWQGGGAFTLAA